MTDGARAFAAELDAYCRSRPAATSAPHRARTAYKVKGRIFATVGADAGINVMATPEEALALAAALPFVSTPGNWWKLGAFHCEPCDAAGLAATYELIDGAHALQAGKKLIRPRRAAAG